MAVRSDGELDLAALVGRVRSELAYVDKQRESIGRDALFLLDEFELELQFTVIKNKEGKGGIDLQVVSMGGTKSSESGEIQTIRLKYSVDPTARAKHVPGARG